MQKNNIPCCAPQYYFEVPAGLTTEDLEDFALFFYKHYQARINQELELTPISGHFAYHVMPRPFLGFLWMSKARRAQYNTEHAPSQAQVPNKRSFIFPVGGLITAQAISPDQDKVLWNFLQQKGFTRWRRTEKFSPKMRTLYYNVYSLSYYQYMAPLEQNPLLQKVWQFRASYNKKYVWRWHYGTYFWGIKPRAGKQILTF